MARALVLLLAGLVGCTAPAALPAAATDPISSALTSAGLECFPALDRPIRLVTCTRKDDGGELRVWFQIDDAGTWVDGFIRSSGEPVDRWRPVLVDTVRRVVPIIDPAMAPVAEQLARDAVGGTRRVASDRGTVSMIADPTGGDMMLTRAGAARTAVPAQPWPGSTETARAALVAAGHDCTESRVELVCSGPGGSTVRVVMRAGAVDHLHLAPIEAFTPGSDGAAELGSWLPAVLGDDRRLPDVVRAAARGGSHVVPVDGQVVESGPDGIVIYPFSW